MNRITPSVGAEHYKTYQITAPVSTHFVTGPCDGDTFTCRAAENGWKMRIDLSTDLGQAQAYYIKYESGRKYTSEKVGDQLFELTFASGQPCFGVHRKRIDRPENYVVKGGDFRGNPRGIAPRIHTKPEFWLEDFAENQDRIAEARRKG